LFSKCQCRSLIPLRKFRGSFYGDEGRKKNSMGRLGECMRIEGRGELGIKDIGVFNNALLGKWIWQSPSVMGGTMEGNLSIKVWRLERSKK